MTRRQFIQYSSVGVATAALFPQQLFASSQQKAIEFLNLHTGESLVASSFSKMELLPNKLTEFDFLLRDHRTNEVNPIDRGLLFQLDKIVTLLGNLPPEPRLKIEIISGYRSPKTNNALRKNSSGVAKKSYHMSGRAVDFRIPGIELAQLREAALSIKKGGVGYYPRSGFIHIDTGPVRSWG